VSKPESSDPVTTYFQATSRYEFTIDARERFEELTTRDLMARARAKLQARGEFDPAKHGDPDKYAPLSVKERLEVLALGQFLARSYRWAGYVGYALQDGATWQQIAEAVDSSEADLKLAYRRWVEGQRQLWLDCDGRVGMSPTEYEEVRGRCSE
jgi:hypothetical protein